MSSREDEVLKRQREMANRLSQARAAAASADASKKKKMGMEVRKKKEQQQHQRISNSILSTTRHLYFLP